MKERPLVCIIMPVFNAEQFLPASIESVIIQDYDNWRLILINDCSSDGSGAICEKYQKSDARIIYLSQNENTGPAHTRNIGINTAVGVEADYLAFIDSDDKFQPNFLSTLVNTAIVNNADIVWCNYYDYFYAEEGRKRIIHHGFKSLSAVDTKILLSCFFEDTPGLGSLCNKIYSVKFVEHYNLRINEDRVRAEDWEFNLMASQCSPKVVAIEDALYNYIHYPHLSVMATYREQDYEMYWRSRDLLKSVAKKYNVTYNADLFDSTMMYNIIDNLRIAKRSGNQIDYCINRIYADTRFKELLTSRTNKRCLLPKSFILVYWSLKLRMKFFAKIVL